MDSSEAQRLWDKLEWEGGVIGLLEYGGIQEFPDELRSYVQELEDAYDRAKVAIGDYLTRNGVDH